MTLRVGYAQRDITPNLNGDPVFLAGFEPNRRATAIHDRLWTRALYLRSDDQHLAIVCADCFGLPRAICQQIEVSASLPVLFVSSHSHYTPDTIGLWGPDQTTSGVDPAYVEQLARLTVTAISEAVVNPHPARLRAAATQVKGVVKNLRDPDIVDNELTVLQFEALDGAPIASLLIFPCHPESLADDNRVITADYVYALRAGIEAETGAPALFAPGALGGMLSPDLPNDARTFESAARIGDQLAQAALDALSLSTPADVSLNFDRAEYTIPLRNPLFEMAMDAGLLPDTRTAAGDVVSEALLVRLGSTWLASVPGELLPKVGLAMKHELRQKGAQVAAIVGLANDELGYILPPEDYVYPDNPLDPGDHYEETMSIGPEAAPRWVKAIRFLL